MPAVLVYDAIIEGVPAAVTVCQEPGVSSIAKKIWRLLHFVSTSVRLDWVSSFV